MPVVVVTGSSSGIGLETAKLFAQTGYSVVLHGFRNLDGLQQAARQIKGVLHAGAWLNCVVADISCEDSCRSMVEACFRRGQGQTRAVDVWINNAGADVLTNNAQRATFEDKLARLWQVDVLGTIRLSRLVAERMLKERGLEVGQAASAAFKITRDESSSLQHQDLNHQAAQSNAIARDEFATLASDPCIINTGWDQAELGMEGDAGQLFCTTKAAIAAFTRSLALTVSPGIRVNAVAPGWIQTDWGKSASDYWSGRAVGESQRARWGTPLDVARAIRWLADPESDFISGQVIHVNGGRRYFTQG